MDLRAGGARVALGFTMALAAGVARAQLPDLPPELIGRAAVVCLKVDRGGHVSGAYVLTSSGSARADEGLLAYVRAMDWGPLGAADKTRDKWLPLGFSFGGAEELPAPETCGPPPNAKPR